MGFGMVNGFRMVNAGSYPLSPDFGVGGLSNSIFPRGSRYLIL